ncbi:ABC transporter ATP-binding protein [Bacillus marinisedimentorum]|uniref:ABC transporter ATP-binding protein n=1 Tax=Bacillus marinisedimentorum TaxID=1821260 RepID=UPI001FE21083|nr:ABC transporter ATP-binding protein [Bacillus marinisedimentorum]
MNSFLETASKMRTALEVLGVTKVFQEKGNQPVEALKDVNISVHEGEFVSIIGPSGCGKSTLLDIISGVTLPQAGEVYYQANPITGKKGVASYMPQKDLLFPWRTIIDNAAVPLEIAGLSRKQARSEARKLLPRFGLEQFADSYPQALSGGMRQRANFLRTILSRKELMLLDEPFGKLDALTRLEVQEWLLEIWRDFQYSVLLVTHDIDEAIFLSDKVYVMSPRPGRITHEVKVPLPRPRSFEMMTSADAVKTKEELLGMLKKSNGSPA